MPPSTLPSGRNPPNHTATVGGATAGEMENTPMSMVEQKRLDFNAPLLSVRRFASPAPPSSAPSGVAAVSATSSGAEDAGEAAAGEGWLSRCSLPFYKSELKSGPVRNPGAVPFVWEKTPGRPKDGVSGDGGPPENPLPRTLPLGAPKLPPGVPPPISPSTSTSPATAAASTSASVALNGVAVAKSMERSIQDSKSKPKPVVAEAPASEEQRGSSDEDDGEEDAFSDAPDALSRTDSCFMNCSMSGLSSGIVDPEASGGFSTDPQVREFMMGRFLPAAQAMTSGSPQTAARKPPLPSRDPERRLLGEGVCRRPPAPVPLPYPYQYRPRHAMYYDAVGYHNLGSGGHSSRGDERYDDTRRRLVKGRGWLPRLCLKSSLCLVNPIPAMKVSVGRMMNCSDRSSEFVVSSQKFEGNFVVRALAEGPMQCDRGSVAVPAPGELCFVDRSYPVKQVANTEEVSRKDHVVHGCKPSKVEEQRKKGSDAALEDILPPALPKSPSESWLCQTLPSVLSKNSTPQSLLGVQLHPKRQVIGSSSAAADPRWEAKARTSAPPECVMRFVDVLSRPADED